MKIINALTSNSSDVVSQAVACLQNGGLLIFPTETTYGAGVDATNKQAVQKLLDYKSRREGKPLSIAVINQAMAAKYVELNDQAKTLYQQFLPGPVTVVSKSLGQVAVGVESEFGTLGVRIPDHELVQQILAQFGKPITATSANASGKPRPYQIDKLLAGLSQKQQSLIDLIIDAGELPHNQPSTVIDTTLSSPVTVRSGDIKTDQLATDRIKLVSNSELETKQIAGKLILQHWNEVKNDGLIIGLDGELGAGKTIFTKGIAQFLQINEQVSSPTYGYMNEYSYDRHGFQGMLYHLDLWKIESETELQRLEIADLIKPSSIIVVEWWSQVANWIKPIMNKQTPLIKVLIEQQSEAQRKITIHE